MAATDIIQHNVETTKIKPSAILKALTVYAQAVTFVQPVLKIKDTEKAFTKLNDMLQHQNFFEFYNEDCDFIDFRYENNKAEEGDLDEMVITVSTYTNDEGTHISLSTWVMLGIKGEDYPLEYDIDDIVYTVEKYFNLEDK